MSNGMMDSKRVELNQQQATILRAITARKQQVEQELAAAITLVGIDPATIVGGDVGEAAPHFLVKTISQPEVI